MLDIRYQALPDIQHWTKILAGYPAKITNPINLFSISGDVKTSGLSVALNHYQVQCEVVNPNRSYSSVHSVFFNKVPEQHNHVYLVGFQLLLRGAHVIATTLKELWANFVDYTFLILKTSC